MASGTTPSPFGFTGELHSEGLVYLRARWYDPSSGVFTSRDPFAGINTVPNTLHPYMYAADNPILYTDPSGKTWYLTTEEAQYLADELHTTSTAINQALDNILSLENVLAAGASATAADLLGNLVKKQAAKLVAPIVTSYPFPSAMAQLTIKELASKQFGIRALRYISKLKLFGIACGTVGFFGLNFVRGYADSLGEFSTKVDFYNTGEKGVAVGTEINQVAILDRTTGKFTRWTPTGITQGWQRMRLFRELPETLLIGEQPPVQFNDANPWWQDYHFDADARWVPLLDPTHHI